VGSQLFVLCCCLYELEEAISRKDPTEHGNSVDLVSKWQLASAPKTGCSALPHPAEAQALWRQGCSWSSYVRQAEAWVPWITSQSCLPVSSAVRVFSKASNLQCHATPLNKTLQTCPGCLRGTGHLPASCFAMYLVVVVVLA
jgi:hypothetical protein